jgi:hypothetical protein
VWLLLRGVQVADECTPEHLREALTGKGRSYPVDINYSSINHSTLKILHENSLVRIENGVVIVSVCVADHVDQVEWDTTENQ